jgi:hypothetical protein
VCQRAFKLVSVRGRHVTGNRLMIDQSGSESAFGAGVGELGDH